MTPLAVKVARALIDGLLPPGTVKIVAPALNGAHFFEATAALPLLEEVSKAAAKSDGPFVPCTFLPAQKTWIESHPPEGKRQAICFVKGDVLDPYLKQTRAIPDTWAVALGFFPTSTADYTLILAGWVDLTTGQPHLNNEMQLSPEQTRLISDNIVRATHLLAVINSPRIVGRRTHPPRKTVARKLERAGFDVGPLHPWHEIKLEVTKPREVDDGETHCDVITGKRCLHFVRKFIRIRLGRLEYVREHWRGDAAVGIHRGSCVVTAKQIDGAA